jgi:hypothetical protein
METLPPENIKNVTAIYQGENNENWTNEKNRTFDLGSLLDIKTMFGREHTVDGYHRDRVIKANNIAFGIGSNEVNARKIPLGKRYTIGEEIYEATDSIRECLINEGLYRYSAIKVLQAFHFWHSDYKYKKGNPCYSNGKFYYANPDDLPAIGESPESHPSKWMTIIGGYTISPILTQQHLAQYHYAHYDALVLAQTNVDIQTGGLLLLDGKQLAEGDIVLLTEQDDKTENGLYAANSGTWERAMGYGPEDGQAFDLEYIRILSGTDAGKLYCTKTERYEIGTDPIEFFESALSPVALPGKIVINDRYGNHAGQHGSDGGEDNEAYLITEEENCLAAESDDRLIFE